MTADAYLVNEIEDYSNLRSGFHFLNRWEWTVWAKREGVRVIIANGYTFGRVAAEQAAGAAAWNEFVHQALVREREDSR